MIKFVQLFRQQLSQKERIFFIRNFVCTHGSDDFSDDLNMVVFAFFSIEKIRIERIQFTIVHPLDYDSVSAVESVGE
jgi:hypothetical protein